MKLVYKGTNDVVKCGDVVHIDSIPHYVEMFREPHKPSSSGHVVVKEMTELGFSKEFYVSVIGAEWIERNDR
jgi:hypothetical protein